jgi:hypothetical protein
MEVGNKFDGKWVLIHYKPGENTIVLAVNSPKEGCSLDEQVLIGEQCYVVGHSADDKFVPTDKYLAWEELFGDSLLSHIALNKVLSIEEIL